MSQDNTSTTLRIASFTAGLILFHYTSLSLTGEGLPFYCYVAMLLSFSSPEILSNLRHKTIYTLEYNLTTGEVKCRKVK